MVDVKETTYCINPFARKKNIELYKFNCREIDPEDSLSLDENEDPLCSPVYVYGVRIRRRVDWSCSSLGEGPCYR